jgi:iron complex outermembrane receptor protein
MIPVKRGRIGPILPIMPLVALTMSIAVVAPPAVIAQTSGAQTPPDPTRFQTEIVVTPERGETPRILVPASTVVLDAPALAALPVVHPAEVVSFLPGFHVAQSQFFAGRPVVSARGFFGGGEAEYILLLVDGQPAADVESGLIDWSLVPTSSVRRIEAFRGPGASMYGDSAIGGVIQILTDRSASGGRLTATGGSFGSFTADSSYGRRSRGVGFNVSGAARRTGGAFDHSDGRQLVGAGAADGEIHGFLWRWSAGGENRRRNDPGALTTAALELDPSASDPLFRFDNAERRNVSTAFTIRNASLSWKPQARVYASSRNEDMIRTILLAPGLADTRARALSSSVIGGSVEGEHAFAGARPPVIRFGVDLAREHLDTSYSSVDTGIVGALNSEAAGRRVRAGLFTSASFEPVPRVRLSGAVRWDDVDDAGFGSASAAAAKRAWSPRAGVVVQLSDSGSIVLFVQASRAFKTPTLDQLFDPRPYPDFQGGTFTISNRTLTPQRATNVEAGISGGGAVQWSLLAYRMNVDNEIDFDVQTFSYANIGQSRHVGAEIEAEGRWWKRVRPSVSYALARVTDLSSDLQLKNVPRHLFTLGASFDLPWAIGAYARYHRAWGAFLDDENAFPIDGPSALDLRVRRGLGRHTAFIDILNATNTVYEEYGYTLTDFQGRTVPYAYPGAPRAIRAGITVSF